MPNTQKAVDEAVAFLKSTISARPTIGFFSGTGLDEAISFIDTKHQFAYSRIPNFPVSTVASHPGRMIVGTVDGKDILAMNGRFHLYEGYSPQQVAFPVRVMRALGVKTLIITNAAGGINNEFCCGDIMAIEDHINLTGDNPLVGPNEDAWGIRFPHMIDAYDRSLIQIAATSGRELGIEIKRGIYAGLKGPSLETPAEIRFLKRIDADAVGFSTVQETIAAVHGGMQVLGLSIITNINNPDAPKPATLEEVIDVAGRATPQLIKIIKSVVSRL